MGAKDLKKHYMSEQELRAQFGITWSKRTLVRRIKSGFPATRIGQSFFFPEQEVLDYFKRRTVKI